MLCARKDVSAELTALKSVLTNITVHQEALGLLNEIRPSHTKIHFVIHALYVHFRTSIAASFASALLEPLLAREATTVRRAKHAASVTCVRRVPWPTALAAAVRSGRAAGGLSEHGCRCRPRQALALNTGSCSAATPPLGGPRLGRLSCGLRWLLWRLLRGLLSGINRLLRRRLPSQGQRLLPARGRLLPSRGRRLQLLPSRGRWLLPSQ